MKYWLFSILTAALSYCIGSLSTLVIASNLVFRSNLRKLGRNNVWLSNFRRIYGIKGFLKLALVEIVKDFIPLIIAGWLFSGGDNAVVGRSLAAFCMILGRMYPFIYSFRGGYASAAIVISALAIDLSMGIAVLAVIAAVTLLTRYVSIGALAGAVTLAAAAILVLENGVAVRLCVITAVLVLVRTMPSIARICAKKENRLSFKEDISYKFDEKF